MINAAKELGRTVGYKPVLEADGSILEANHIISGRFVKLMTVESGEVVIAPVTGEEEVEKCDVLGIACDDTKRMPFNGMYEVIDSFCKYGKVAAFVCGGIFSVWNDGRGAVFAEDVINAVAGTPLFIGATGLTATAGEAGTVGSICVGSVMKAPESADGVLLFKAKGL